MTTQPSTPEDSEEFLAKAASQVAQQSRTLALHVRQHDDVEAAAQQKADAVIENLRASLESAHQVAVEGAAGNIQLELDGSSGRESLNHWTSSGLLSVN